MSIDHNYLYIIEKEDGAAVTKKNTIRDYRCRSCGNVLPGSFMKKHFVTGSSEDVACLHCGFQISRQDFFTVQTSASYNPSRKPLYFNLQRSKRIYQCPKCVKTFNFKSHLDRHLKSHSHAKEFVCEKCSAKFKHHFQLIQHTRMCYIWWKYCYIGFHGWFLMFLILTENNGD